MLWVNTGNRKELAVHVDPVNLFMGPWFFYHNRAMIKEVVRKVGPYPKSTNAKDIHLDGKFMVHLNEAIPGAGALD
jgi:hypothetical protein